MSGSQTYRVAAIVFLTFASLIGTGMRWQTTQRVLAQSSVDVTKSLQGKWSVKDAKRDGRAVDDVTGVRLTFSVRRFEIRYLPLYGEALYTGTFVLDTDADPPTINFHHDRGALKGKHWKGIYSLEGDLLTICDNSPDLEKPRPVDFESKRDSGHLLIKFGRMINGK